MRIGFDKTSRLFLANYEAKRRVIINQGGTSSGKTYSILQVLILKAIQAPNQTITVVGESIPNLKRGSYRDFETICANEPWVNHFIKDWNKTDRTVNFITGSRIEFTSYETGQSAKNGKRHYCFLNEANGIDYEIAEEIMLRTEKQVFIDYNPSAKFWLHDRVLPDTSTYTFIKSTWKHNPFIAESVRLKILSYEHTDPYRWQVYGLGELGKREGLVYPNWIPVDEMPVEYDWEVYGLDFGFTNDPTVLIRCRKSGQSLFFQTVFHDTGLGNREIIRRARLAGLTEDDMIYADHAVKDIADLRHGFPEEDLEGLLVVAAKKGPDSIENGINKLNEYACHYLKSDQYLTEELLNYEYIKVDGRATNKPIDAFNHCLDACRYAAVSHTYRNR